MMNNSSGAAPARSRSRSSLRSRQTCPRDYDAVTSDLINACMIDKPSAWSDDQYFRWPTDRKHEDLLRAHLASVRKAASTIFQCGTAGVSWTGSRKSAPEACRIASDTDMCKLRQVLYRHYLYVITKKYMNKLYTREKLRMVEDKLGARAHAFLQGVLAYFDVEPDKITKCSLEYPPVCSSLTASLNQMFAGRVPPPVDRTFLQMFAGRNPPTEHTTRDPVSRGAWLPPKSKPARAMLASKVLWSPAGPAHRTFAATKGAVPPRALRSPPGASRARK